MPLKNQRQRALRRRWYSERHFRRPIPACGEIPPAPWDKWQADFSGSAIFHTNAQFNDVVGVFTGGCAALNSIVCDNYDEHGFIGENTRFEAVAGTSYLIRVSDKKRNLAPKEGRCAFR